MPMPEALKVVQEAHDEQPPPPAPPPAIVSKKENGSALSPYGPGSVFAATIVRSEEDPIGLDIDLIDGISAVVVDIKEGAVKSWNEKNPEHALQVNDRIVEVNGQRREANSMVSRLKSDTTWAVQVQRPVEFAVSISRADTPSLGMDLRYAPNGTTLMITQVGEGPMQEWNKKHPDKAVCKHDRIIQLNKVRGTPTQLLQASEDSETLNMIVIHYPKAE